MYQVAHEPPARKSSSDESANLAALEAAMERDRRFFARHPLLAEYDRGNATPTEAEFLKRVVPWPEDGEPGFINLHWLIPAPGDPTKRILIGKPARTIEEFLSLLEWVLSRPTTKDVYFCLSLQAKAKKDRCGNRSAVRNQKNAIALKAVWLDIDVKPPPKGYATLAEALDALAAFVKATGLPLPSALVDSGGGLHVYWISVRALTPDEWRPLAQALKAAAIKHGLRCNAQFTVNAAHLLRVPGTFNHKPHCTVWGGGRHMGTVS